MALNQNFNQNLLTSLTNLAGGNEVLRRGFESGLDISGLGGPNVSPEDGFFGFNSLGRLGDTLNIDQADLLTRARERDPGRASEEQRGLDILAGLGDRVGPTLPTQLGFDRLVPRTEGPVNLEGSLQTAIDTASGRLGGLSSPEMTALREQGADQINRQLQTNLMGLNISNAGRGLQGAAGMAPALDFSRGALDARRGLERDLLLANVAERRSALQDLGNLGQIAGQQRLQAQGMQDANILNLLRSGQAQEQAEFGRQQQFGSTLSDAATRQRGLEEEIRAGRLGTFANTFNQVNQDLLGRQVFNLGQLEKEKAGQLGLLFGIPGLASQEQARKDALDLANRQLDISESFEVTAPPSFTFEIGGGGSDF